LLFPKAKQVGLSPIQIQILIFIAYHKQGLCNVSHLAKEFNVTKPTISDAIKVLDKKKMIVKDYSPADSRSYNILLSELGQQIVSETNDFAEPVKGLLHQFNDSTLDDLFNTISQLIFKLNQTGILNVQRTCYGCRFYHPKEEMHFCTLLQKELLNKDIRLDCLEYQEKDAD
ncbi:MAG: MarR family winged helix-turn-helix transcriptional regulator, partial [Bacteroidota bacterium]